MIFEVECDTTNELTDRTDAMIVPFIVLDGNQRYFGKVF